MIGSRLILLSAISILAAVSGCGQSYHKDREKQEKIVDEFKRLSASIDRSYHCEDCYEEVYPRISDSGKYYGQGALASADSVYRVTKSLERYIGWLKERLQKLPPDETDVHGTLTMQEIYELRNKVAKVSVACRARSSIQGELQQLDSIFSHSEKMLSTDEQIKKYFDNSPVVAQMALLSICQNDCKKGAVIVLEGVEKRDKKR